MIVPRFAVQQEAVSEAPATTVHTVQEYLDLAKAKAIEVAPQILAAVGIAIVGWLAVRLIVRLLRRLLERARVDATLREFITSFVYVAGMVFVAIAAIQKLGVPTASFVAILGAAGFAIAFALQGSLSNLAAGVLLMFFRPIRVGDRVEIAGVDGVVKEIGVFATVVHTFDNRRVTVPNSKVTDGNIVNFTINGSLRVDMEFSIGYGDDIGEAIAAIESVLAKNDLILRDPAPVVAVKSHGDSSIQLACRPWCRPEHTMDVWFRTHRAVKEAFDARGIEIPFPQRDVHLKGEMPAGAASGERRAPA